MQSCNHKSYYKYILILFTFFSSFLAIVHLHTVGVCVRVCRGEEDSIDWEPFVPLSIIIVRMRSTGLKLENEEP